MNSSCNSLAASNGISIGLCLKPSQPRLPASLGTLRKPPCVQTLGKDVGALGDFRFNFLSVPFLLSGLHRAPIQPPGTSYLLSWEIDLIRVLLMDFFPILNMDTPLPSRPTLKANPPPTAHQPLPVGGQPPPLLHCGSWGLLSPQRALGTGGKRRDNLSAQNNLCYTDLSLDNHKTEMITCLANSKSESNPYQIRESNLEILNWGSANHSLWAKTGLLLIFIQPKSSEWFFTFSNGYILSGYVSLSSYIIAPFYLLAHKA